MFFLPPPLPLPLKLSFYHAISKRIINCLLWLFFQNLYKPYCFHGSGFLFRLILLSFWEWYYLVRMVISCNVLGPLEVLRSLEKVKTKLKNNVNDIIFRAYFFFHVTSYSEIYMASKNDFELFFFRYSLSVFRFPEPPKLGRGGIMSIICSLCSIAQPNRVYEFVYQHCYVDRFKKFFWYLKFR